MTYAIEREDDFDFLSPGYERLHAASVATAFQHGVWLNRFYATLAPALAARPLVVTIRRATDRELLLVLPLVRTGRVLRTVTFADLGVADYNTAIASSSVLEELRRDPQVGREVRRAIGRFDLLRIDRVVGSADHVSALLAGSHVRRHHYDTHLLTLAETTQGWRDTLDPKFVRRLDKAHKRMRPKGEQKLRVVDDVAEVGPMMLRLQAFRAARFSDRRAVDLVQDAASFEFYRAIAEDSVREGGPGRLAVLEVADAPVAIAFDLVEPDRQLHLLVGYDVERLRNYSLGLLIVDALVRDAIDRNKSFFDLTVGDESYKSDFGARPRPLFQVRVAGTLRGRVAMVGQDAELSARRVAKRLVAVWEERRSARRARANGATPHAGARTTPG